MEREERIAKQDSSASPSQSEAREVVGIFGSLDSLQSAIDELLTKGFDRSEISLLADDSIVREKVGDAQARALEDDMAAPRSPYIESESLNEVKAGVTGVLLYVAAFIGAGLMMIAGGSAVAIIMGGAVAAAFAVLIGIIVARFIGERETNWAKAQLRRGGLLLWARVRDAEHERVATEVMQRNGGADIHAHAL